MADKSTIDLMKEGKTYGEEWGIAEPLREDYSSLEDYARRPNPSGRYRHEGWESGGIEGGLSDYKYLPEWLKPLIGQIWSNEYERYQRERDSEEPIFKLDAEGNFIKPPEKELLAARQIKNLEEDLQIKYKDKLRNSEITPTQLMNQLNLSDSYEQTQFLEEAKKFQKEGRGSIRDFLIDKVANQNLELDIYEIPEYSSGGVIRNPHSYAPKDI
jgi:hypothetical protein|tara:strand:- start:3782 stop:4423 length:642 start_codon:yes stop_codon:yes gene_type:complete